jgi:hypothetical protein
VTTSLAIDRLLEVAARLGYQVSFEAPRNKEASGYVDYAARRIWVEPAHEVTQALTLLHELGHALAAERMGYGPKAGRSRRSLQRLRTGEDRAYLYGWAIAVRTELGGEQRITRNLWRLFNGIESCP